MNYGVNFIPFALHGVNFIPRFSNLPLLPGLLQIDQEVLRETTKGFYTESPVLLV